MKSEHQFVALVLLTCFLLVMAYVFYIGIYSVPTIMSHEEQAHNDTIVNYDDSTQPPSNDGMHNMQYLAATASTTTDSVQHEATTDMQYRTTTDTMQYRTATDSMQHRAITDTGHPTTDPVSQRTRLAVPTMPTRTTLCTRYDGASQNFSTQDLIVRAAYFDDRPRGNHRNSTVILTEVRISILKQNRIIGCAVGEHATTDKNKFGVHTLRLTHWVHSHHPELSHDTVFVDCFDLPVQNGSRTFVLYKQSIKDIKVTCVESERPLMIPAPYRAPAKGHKFSVALCCAPIYGMPPLLTEWLQYQKTLAFDHVHLIAEDSFLKAGGLENKELKQGMQEGFVTVDVWKPWLKGRQVYYHSQVLAHEDCIYRLRGTYDYVMLLDADEFFTPRVANEKGIHYYVKKCCSYRRCGSCHFHGLMYYPDCGMKGKVGEDGNITNQLVSYKFLDQAAQGKSVHRSAAIVETGCHRGNEYIKRYRSVEFPLQLAYVAHVRKGKKPKEC